MSSNEMETGPDFLILLFGGLLVRPVAITLTGVLNTIL
jgi:hypothetical protein